MKKAALILATVAVFGLAVGVVIGLLGPLRGGQEHNLGAFPSHGLVAHWRFDEGEGDVVFDSTANANNGLVVGPVWKAGDWGYALSFDGVDDYISVPDNPSLNVRYQISIAAWIRYQPAKATTQALVTKRSRANKQGYALEVANGRLQLRLYDGATEYIATGDAVPADEWVHVVVTWDGATVRFYMQGELSRQETKQFKGPIAVSTQPLNIGRWVDYPTSLLWSGLIGELAIWNRALTATEVRQIYEQGMQ